jgi:alpha-glucosidase
MTRFFTTLIAVLFISSHGSFGKSKDKPIEVDSPNRKVKVQFLLKNGAPFYRIQYLNKILVTDSRLGFILKEQPALNKDFKIISSTKSSTDETWTQPWGEVKNIRNHYNGIAIDLEEQTGLKRKLNVMFRVYDDGIGFRYELPEQPNLKEFVILDELTEFSLKQDFSSWWIPAYGTEMDSEYLYRNTKLSEIKEKVSTPITLESNDNLFVSIHEAALVDYAGMALALQPNFNLKCDLVPWSNGNRVEAKVPMKTPWRTIQIASRPGDLITSYLILNLNEPNKLDDVSWIKPGKYNGIWWGMHVGKNTWEVGQNHGATTENVKTLIDFASKHNLSAVLAEGWNEGWEGDWTVSGNFSFTKPYPDFDLEELSRYAKSRNIGLIAHHETGGNVKNYENQLEEAFKQCQFYGIQRLKTGYVNKMPSGERHQNQFMVRHYHKVMETAARYNVMLDVHEPVKDTGLRRTYPNMMTREGVRGTEYEAWSDGNPPSHTTVLPFTRGLAGPIDYTPGIFDIMFKNKGAFRVHTTLAKQLALYVVIFSPMHMAADLPENYEGNPAFKFVEDVPTDWEDTKILQGKIGQYITTVRKDRNSDDWYLGSITNEAARALDVKLNFLDPQKKYKAEIYQDGKDADVTTNPLPIEIKTVDVNASTTLTLKLAAGGGTAIRFYEVNP